MCTRTVSSNRSTRGLISRNMWTSPKSGMHSSREIRRIAPSTNDLDAFQHQKLASPQTHSWSHDAIGHDRTRRCPNQKLNGQKSQNTTFQLPSSRSSFVGGEYHPPEAHSSNSPIS